MGYYYHRQFLAGGACALTKISRFLASLSSFDATSDRHQQSTDPASTMFQEQNRRIPRTGSETWAADDTRNEFDFIIVGGSGTAGQGAAETLSRTCQNARVALIDPHTSLPSRFTSNRQEFRARVTSLDPGARVVRVEGAQGEFGLRYKHGVLLATGARGAPPPHYLMDDASGERILELRPTVTPHQLQKRPILSKEEVKRRLLSVADAGGRIAVLGSGWEALDVASSCTARGSASRARVCLYFGGAAPLKNFLPNYLASAVSKRLRSRRIELRDRTLVRYISCYNEKIARTDARVAPGDTPLQLHSVKSYDYLDSSVDKLNLVVIAPEVSGDRGTAVLPTSDTPNHLKDTSKGRSWYRPWSLLSIGDGITSDSHYGIACYKDDGRVAVNCEMCACTGVYAAGSVAKYPNLMSGHAAPAGYGAEDSSEAGHVAAWNMSRLYRSHLDRSEHRLKIKSSVPVFRTDNLPALQKVGIGALRVGNCDSERFSTHGVWWTNLAAHRRSKIQGKDDDDSSSSRRSCSDVFVPVYGIGVVYYVDSARTVQGVMTWGIPYTSGKEGDLNLKLCTLMKEMVMGTGDNRSFEGGDTATDLTEHLTKKSRQLVSAALDHDDVNSAVEPRGLTSRKPLYRVTEASSPHVRSHVLLKRKDGNAQGMSGEDIFFRLPRSLKRRLDSCQDAGTTEANPQDVWDRWLQVEREFDENEALARPSREDQLWIRKGDEMRNSSARETKAAAYKAAIFASVR